jgi:hypothetical protein
MLGGYACDCAATGGNNQQDGGVRKKRATKAKAKTVRASASKGSKASSAAKSPKKAAPKRKLTPYNLFVKKQYAILKAQHPNDTAPQIMKKIGAEWRKQ